MAIRKRKPTSPGRRFQTSSDFSEITAIKPERSLVKGESKSGGRNLSGSGNIYYQSDEFVQDFDTEDTRLHVPVDRKYDAAATLRRRAWPKLARTFPPRHRPPCIGP